MKNRKIYIMLSRTHTTLGIIIQNVLDSEYNHCSIALEDNPNLFYSFGRKRANNFLFAGFVFESKDFGFFKVFNSSRVCILELAVTEEQYAEAESIINTFKLQKNIYGFNIVGLALAKFSIPYGAENYYFCSQFVSEVLRHSDIYHFHKDSRLVSPPDMFEIPESKVVYAGPICDYMPADDLVLKEAISF